MKLLITMIIIVMDFDSLHGIHKQKKEPKVKSADSSDSVPSESLDTSGSKQLRDWKPYLFPTKTQNPAVWYPETSDESGSRTVYPTWKPEPLPTTTKWWWSSSSEETTFPTTQSNWPPDPITKIPWRPDLLTTKRPDWLPELFPTSQAVWGGHNVHSSSDSGSSEVPYGVINRLGTVTAGIFPNTDFVCSPVCSLMPLGKLALGGSGKTKRELLNALGLTSRGEVSGMFAKTIHELKFLKGVKLNMASAIYVAPNISLNDKYQNEVKSVFSTSLMRLTAKDPIGAANEINKWVSTETNGMINNVIVSNQITRLTKLILVNAIYFSGTWRYKFKSVGPATFYSPSGELQIPFMRVKAPFKYTYSNTLKSQVLQLPYSGGEASMVIVLPSHKDTVLSDVVNIMKKNPTLVQEVLQNAPARKDLDVILPKFKVKSTVDLKTVYRKLGLKNMFKQKKNNFLAMCSDEDLYVTQATQKAIIEVNEEGTEAASTSTVVITAVSAPMSFTANRPFYFIVYAKDQQLFSGQFYATNVF